MIDLTQPHTHRAWGKHRRNGVFVCWKDLGPAWAEIDEHGAITACFDEQSMAVGHDKRYWIFPNGVTPPDPLPSLKKSAPGFATTED